MAWETKGSNMSMVHGDYGVGLDIDLKGRTIVSTDSAKITIKQNGTAVVTKTFTNIQDNKITLQLTSSDAEALTPGLYLYDLDWYQGGVFQYTITHNAEFRVVKK